MPAGRFPRRMSHPPNSAHFCNIKVRMGTRASAVLYCKRYHGAKEHTIELINLEVQAIIYRLFIMKKWLPENQDLAGVF